MSKKVKDLIKVLKAAGWYIDRTNRHHVFKHPDRGTVSGLPLTVSKHEKDDLPIGTYNGILKDAGLK